MKKLLLILLCLPMIGFGQEILESNEKKMNQNSFEIGVVFGSTSSNIYGKLKDLYNTSSSTNVSSMQRKNGGLMLRYNISDLLSVKSKLLYQVKGWNLQGNTLEIGGSPDGGLGTYDVDASIYNHYISLPILMQINFGSKLRGTINTGFYASYLLDVIDITEYSNIETTIRVVLVDNIIVDQQYKNKGNPQRYTGQDPIAGYNRLDLGFIVGGGVSYIINDIIRLSFESNLEYGLINKNIQENSPFTNYNITYNFLFGCSYIL